MTGPTSNRKSSCLVLELAIALIELPPTPPSLTAASTSTITIITTTTHSHSLHHHHSLALTHSPHCPPPAARPRVVWTQKSRALFSPAARSARRPPRRRHRSSRPLGYPVHASHSALTAAAKRSSASSPTTMSLNGKSTALGSEQVPPAISRPHPKANLPLPDPAAETFPPQHHHLLHQAAAHRLLHRRRRLGRCQ